MQGRCKKHNIQCSVRVCSSITRIRIRKSVLKLESEKKPLESESVNSDSTMFLVAELQITCIQIYARIRIRKLGFQKSSIRIRNLRIPKILYPNPNPFEPI